MEIIGKNMEGSKNNRPESFVSEIKTGDEIVLKKFFEERSGYFDDFFIMISNNSREEPEKFYGAVAKVTGYSSEELNSMPGGILSIIHEDDLESYKRTYFDISRNNPEGTTYHTFRVLHKTRKIVWIEENIKVHSEDEKIWYERLLRDVTIYKEREKDLLAKYSRIEYLNNAKDKFISIVSHDLRSPFTSLLGFAEILLNEPDLPEEEKEEYLRYIHKASETQLELVNHLLDWSRLQLGKIVIEPVRLNVRMIVSNAISALTGLAVRKGVEIITDIQEDLYFFADSKLIERVISNLVNNAIKFTPPEKTITVTAGKFGKGMIELVVKDEGIGIEEKDQSKLFKLEEKFSTDGTEGEKGSGLGLMLVKEIVEKHNGEIWFYSELGNGSEFHFTVPEARQIFMIVDDDPQTLKLYKNIIASNFQDSEIMVAENGFEALNLTNEKIPSIIITDNDMPLMNGAQMIEVFQKNSLLKNIPVIVITGDQDDETKEKYNKLGIHSLLSKPIKKELLIEEINNFA